MSKKTSRTPPGLKPLDMVKRIDVPRDALLTLITLSFGPATRDDLMKLAEKDENVGAGIARLVEDRLVEARDGALHMRPVEAWENESHFMAALAVRW